MKSKRLVMSVLTLFLLMPMSAALADHQGGGDVVSHLATEAQELDSLVRYSYLRWNVKSAVSSFAIEANRLQSVCRGFSNGGEPNGREPNSGEPNSVTEPLDHNGGDQGCDLQLSRTVRAFSPVERYLYDAYYDFNQIYNQYVSVREALNVVRSTIH